MVCIKKVVVQFSNRFPESALASTLLREPQELSGEEFLAKVQTWLSILDSEKGFPR